MDNEPADNSMISRRSWHVALWLSGFLRQAEREAVLGDLVENGESGGRAIVNILGLLVRRHTAVLFHLRLWLAVTLVILPVGFLLSGIAENTAGEGAVYSWMYLNNWDWALTENPGFWHLLRETAVNLGIAYLVLACWSWSGGFLIGRLPKAILHTGRNAFIVLITASWLVDAPGRLDRLWMSLHGLPARPLLPDVHAPITANIFYHVFFPWIVLAILVILPAFSGMREGNRSLFLNPKMRAVLATAAIISLLTLLVQSPDFGLLLGAPMSKWLWHTGNVMQVLSLLSCWPAFYWIATAFCVIGGRLVCHK